MSYVEGSAVRTIFSKRSRVAVVALIVTAMLGTGLTLGLSSQGVDAAPVADVVDSTVCYGFDEGTGNATEDQQFLHEVALTAGNPPTAVKAQVPVLSDPAGNIESIALRNDASEIYAYDPAANQMFVVNADDGVQTPATDYNLTALGDIDAMFFQNDTDGDPSNDILWTLTDIDDAVAGNADADELRGYDTGGNVVAGPVSLVLPVDTTVEGATWLPDANGGTGEFFISYTTTAAAVDSTLASLGTAAVPASSPVIIGTTQVDVEGLGTDGAGQLFITTGEDGVDANNFYQVDNAGAVSTLLLDMGAGAPVGGDTDFESIDCAFASISLTKATTEAPSRLPNGNAEVSYTFTITNDGELQLANVTLTDPMADYVAANPAAIVSGPTPDDINGDCSTAVATGTQTLNIGETCTAVWIYEVDVPPASYDNTASVTGTPPNGVAGPVTDTGTATAVIPAAGAPALDIIKTVAADAASCPADFAAAGPNVGLDTIPAATGSTVVYCINVINNGPGTADDVIVTDNLDAASPRSIGTLAAAGEDSYNYTVTVGANPETNVAVASGNDQDGNPAPTATDNAGTIDPTQAPDLDIIKTVVADAANCPATFADAAGNVGLDTIEVLGGTAVIYCINVINNGPGTATDVSVSDDLDAAAPRALGTLFTAGESRYDYVVNAPQDSQVNVAVVSGNDVDSNPAPTATDNAGTTPAPPTLTIVKTVVDATLPCPAPVAGLDTIPVATGAQVKYCITVTNTGPGNAFGVTVTDDLDPASPRALGDILLNGTQSYDYTVTVGANPETNVAVVAGNDGDGDPVATATDNAGTTEPIVLPSSISNLVFEDTNGDGIQDAGEDGISGVTVNLLNDAGAVIATTVTDANGEYIFSNLAPGTYQVQFIAANGRTISPQDQGGDDAADSDADPATGITADIVLPGNTDDTSVDAGLSPLPGPSSISNLVFEDTNEDGIQDVGEAGIGGITVNLLNAAGAIIGTTTTDANGEYIFDGLAAGTYQVQFIAPNGRDLSPQDQGGDDTLDSDADPATGITADIILPADTDDTSVDAGMTPLPQPGSISNLVFEDVNEDGVQDAGDTPVAGVTVNLLNAAGAIIGTDTTDVNGEYLFSNLAAGAYTVQFIAPNGRTFIPADQGGDDTLDSDPDPATGETAVINLANGEDNVDVDAGLVPEDQIATIGNFVWTDDNNNGVQDAGEDGIAGATVIVYETDIAGNLLSTVATLTTDANGEWTQDVVPGNYRISVVVPTGASGFTTPNAGGDDATDSDIDNAGGSFGFSPVYTVASGDSNLTIDAGIVFPPELAELGNFVWEDENNNGVQDAGEDGIPGIAVQVLDGAGNVAGTDTTDANGAYLVTDLLPGTYTVSFINTTTGTFTGQDLGGDDATDSDANAAGQTVAVTLAEGESNLTIDAGIVFPPDLGSISNFVWEDTNLDGVQDAGEAGIAGIQVQVFNGATLVGTDTTDANGEYLVGNLPAGDYTVQFNLPGGRTLTAQDQGGDDTLDSDPDVGTGRTAVITLAAGEDNVDVDAGVVPIPLTGSISNFVWEDTNEDGVQDAGEPAVSGVTVTLRNSLGAIVGTDVTDAAGEYLFDNLAAGDYTVEFTLPGSREFTAQDQGGDDTLDSDANPATGVTAVIALAAGEDNVDVDAGVLPIAGLGSISNFVFEDTNEDGIQDAGEPPVAGVTVNLWSSVAGAPNAVIATDATDAAGEYLFDNLAEGNYFVQFVTPRDFTAQDAGADDTVDSDPNPADGVTAEIALGAGEDNVDVDAGLLPVAEPGSISNLVFEDTNENGVQDAGEPPVAGVTVNLWSSNAGEPGAIIATATTDAAGEYLFGNLAEANYFVQFVTPRDFTAQDAGADDTVDSDPNPADGITAEIPLGAGEDNVDVDAGLLPVPGPSSISNFVFEDTNEDGIQDAGEPPVAGVTVNLWSSVAGAPGAVIATDVTDAAGAYLFENLPAGDYFVQFVAPTGRTFTAQDAGADDAVDSDPNPADGITAVITLPADTDDTTVDAGLLPIDMPGSISNLVFEDTNEDGIQDAGEPPVAGVTVNLWSSVGGAPGAIIATDVTDAAGEYIFDNLTPGDYFVQFVAPTGRTLTLRDAGGDDALDSDANPSGGVTAVITLGSGENNVDVDAGLLPLPGVGSISDFVFVDTDQDGVQDVGETGLAGVTVTVRDAAGTVVGTTVTDASGAYTVGNLPAGDYTVQFTLPGGRTFTTQNAGGDDTLDSDVDPATGLTATITLAAGANDTSVDAGVLPIIVPDLGSISDFVFLDSNNNGIQDAGEPGVQNVVVTVREGVTIVGSDVTDSSGAYSVGNLPAGDYTVEFTLPGGLTFTTQNEGADDTVDSDPNPANGVTGTITLAEGEDNTSVDAGVAADVAGPTGSISNIVFQDTDGDGIQDAGEPGVQGVVVRVLDSNGLQVGTDTTDANGAYIISNLPAGDYTVEFILPGNLEFTTQDAGADDLLDSDVDPATGLTATITLAAGENNVSIDAGVVPLENPVIGLAKRVTAGPTLVVPNISVTYTFVIENLGNTDLSGITIADDFATTFAGATIISGPTPDGGDCSAAVAAAPGHNLAVGESCTAVWTVVVGDWVEDTTYNNTATVTGTSPAGTTVTDVSDDGVEPDANSNGNPGDPGEDTPTPLLVNLTPNDNPAGGVTCGSNSGLTFSGTDCPVVLEYPGPFNNAPEMTPEPATAPAAQVPLAHTGSNASVLATLAIALMGAGGALMIGARRKSDDED